MMGGARRRRRPARDRAPLPRESRVVSRPLRPTPRGREVEKRVLEKQRCNVRQRSRRRSACGRVQPRELAARAFRPARTRGTPRLASIFLAHLVHRA